MYNTGNPLGSTAPKDFSDNSEITDRYVNDVVNETTQDRFGRSRLTIHGIEKKAEAVIANLGFFPPVDYTTGLTVDSRNFTTTYNGIVYAAQPSAVPFTTGAWDAAHWYPIQNVLNQKNLLVFDTYAEASAAAATLPDGQTVFVRPDKYTVASGALTNKTRYIDIIVATDYGLSVTNTALANADALVLVSAESEAVYLPDGVFPLDKSAISVINNTVGPGYFDVEGTVIPAGNLRGNLTLPVPSVFPDIYSAYAYIGSRLVLDDFLVTISVAAGLYEIDKSIYKIPSGKQVRILGAGRDVCTLKWMGPEWISGSTANRISFIDLERDGHLHSIDGFTLDGNNRRGQSTPPNPRDPHAIIVRRGSSLTIGADMRIKDWARVGALTNQNSDLLILGDATKSAEFSGCYTEGVVASAGCTVIANYTKSNGNLGYGFWADAGGVILGTQLTANGNTHGLFAYQGGKIVCDDGADFSSQTNNNTGHGIYANGGQIKSPNAKASGNTLSNVSAIYNADINLRGTSSRKSVLTNSAAGVVATTGSHVDLFRAEINSITGIGINVDNATADIGNAVVTACTGGELSADNGASVVGDLANLSGTGANHVTVRYRNGASVNLPRSTVVATGTNARAVEGAMAVCRVTSGVIDGPAEPNGYAWYLADSAVLVARGSTVTGWQSPPANTAGTRNSYAHM